MAEKISQGEETLIPKSEWVDKKEIQGTDAMVLQHPMMNRAFEKILDLHKPKHDIALVSLCTSTRPYSKSIKWKTYKQKYGNYCDCIIASNGGIIPMEFENCYPYLTYDAHGQAKYDNLYNSYLLKRFKLFFNKFPYKYIVFNFRHNLRNVKPALKFKKEYKQGKCFIVPTKKAYELDRKNNFKPYSRYYPDLAYNSQKQMEKIIFSLAKIVKGDK